MAGSRGGGFFYHGYHGSARPATAGRDITDRGEIGKWRKLFSFLLSVLTLPAVAGRAGPWLNLWVLLGCSCKQVGQSRGLSDH